MSCADYNNQEMSDWTTKASQSSPWQHSQRLTSQTGRQLLIGHIGNVPCENKSRAQQCFELQIGILRRLYYRPICSNSL